MSLPSCGLVFRACFGRIASRRFWCCTAAASLLAAVVSAETAPAPTTRPTTLPAANIGRFPQVTDAQVGQAIQRGVNHLLGSFKNGQLEPDTNLSDSQNQALDALCIYALLQSGEAIHDSRLSIQNQSMQQILARLASFDLSSDGKVTNRPITYGRSLRAAALATYDRSEDRNVLKADVAWLIQNQINGAYTYDGTYEELIKQGLHPNPDAASQPPSSTPPNRNSGVSSREGFGGSSVPVPFDTGPYPPGSSAPPSVPALIGPGIPRSSLPATGGGGGRVQLKVGPPNMLWPHFPHFLMQPPPPRIIIVPPVPGSGGGKLPKSGGYGYGRPGSGPIGDNQVPPPDLRFVFPWDNSNSQYGLLGVWAGAEVGMEVPDSYWQAVEDHWLRTQLKTGQWAYRANELNGYFAMTCAGVASLLVTHDYLDLPMLKGHVGRPPYSNNLEAGLGWLDQADNSVAIPDAGTHYLGYDLFGLERVGLASGFKFFGPHDWYRELVSRIVPLQHPNGSWGADDHGLDTVVDTAYTLLFLARGRHPVLMTKLKFGRFWDNRPRDLSNLARFAAKEVERKLNWQVVDIEHPWYDWFDSPVLYIASHAAPQLRARDYSNLRNYVLAGGMIFTNADMGSASFNEWARNLAQKILPGSKLQPIANDDPIYSIQYKLRSHPPLFGVSNGVRWLLVHSPNDIAVSWELRDVKRQPVNFQLGTNLFLYASGKPDLRNRIDSPYLLPPDAPPATWVKLARVKYDGNWDPEPAAWPRFSRLLEQQTHEALDLAISPADKPVPDGASIATLTGTQAHSFSESEKQSLRRYVEAGGVLLIDCCGGKNAFAQSVRQDLLEGAFSQAKSVPLTPDHALLQNLKPQGGSPMRLRPYAMDQLGHIRTDIQLLRQGKGYVIFSPLDITNGLLGTHTWGVAGYEPDACEHFALNLVNWATDLHGKQ